MLGDGLLSEQLESDGSHQVPLVLKLQGPLVLQERHGMGGIGGRTGRMRDSGETEESEKRRQTEIQMYTKTFVKKIQMGKRQRALN